jgi:hypothetical protein
MTPRAITPTAGGADPGKTWATETRPPRGRHTALGLRMVEHMYEVEAVIA